MTKISQLVSSLEPGQTLRIKPEGSSMCPLFWGGRDEVFIVPPVFPLKKGEIALFFRHQDEKYIIHRVWKIVKNNDIVRYYMLGDNQTEPEGPISEEDIHAVASHIKRKGHMIDCKKSILYRLYVHTWLFLRPMRPFLGKIISFIRKHRL